MIDSQNWVTCSNPKHGQASRRRTTTQHRRRRRCGGCRSIRRAWLRCPWAVVEPGRGAGGRRQGQGGPRDRPLRAAGSRVAISRAGRRPRAHSAARPTGQEAQRAGPPAPGTPAAPHATTTRVRQRGGYRSTRPLSAHSATASSRLRPNDPQSWRRRRIHRNMPPTTAAPRPAPPIRPSKPVRARPFFGLVAGTSGAT